MIRLLRRPTQQVPSFADLTAEVGAALAGAARRRQDAAWATYAPNVLTVGFVR